MEPGPLCWEHRVLAMGPPGKSLEETLDQFHLLLSVAQANQAFRGHGAGGVKLARKSQTPV